MAASTRSSRRRRNTSYWCCENRPTAEVDAAASRDRTRDAVARLILERGPQTAAALAERLGLSPAGVRRHLDALVADGLLVEREPRPSPQSRPRPPARVYALTDAGRAAFPHAYDDLATTALRYLRDTGGERRRDRVRRAPRAAPWPPICAPTLDADATTGHPGRGAGRGA